MSSEQQAAAMEGHPAASAKKLWRVLRAVYLVLVRGLGKHQPKLAALGVHLHQLLLSRRYRHHDGGGLAAAVREHPALTYYLSALSCRSMDPAAAVVHPYPRTGGGGAMGGAGLSSLSCRSMDPAAAVYQYQYRPREVEFSCSSTPLHKRRRAQRRHLRLQHHDAAAGNDAALPPAEYGYGSAAAVTRLFELLDIKEAAADTTEGGGGGDLETMSEAPWAAPAPARQVRITDSPFPAREDAVDEDWGVVDRRADEFIMWFHEQLRMQQPRAAAAAATATARERSTAAPYYWVR